MKKIEGLIIWNVFNGMGNRILRSEAEKFSGTIDELESRINSKKGNDKERFKFDFVPAS